MLGDLKKMVIGQKSAGLPFEAPSAALEGLHAALVEYDQVVSRAVIQTIQGVPVDDPADQIREMQAAIDAHFTAAGSGRDVETYRKYFNRLDTMLALVRQIAQEPGS